jgi:beta-N-acetylhexosaminidase
MKKQQNRIKKQQKIFFVLLLVVFILGTLNIVKARGLLIPEQPNLSVVDGAININSMTLEQKIAQMVVVHGGMHNLEPWKNMQLGGIHLFAMAEPELFSGVIDQFQEGMAIPFFVTADLEGCLNPFAAFHESTPVSEIFTVGEAYQKGSDEGKLLKEIGFSLNYAPVVDLEDQIWKCRSFPGDEKKVSELAEAYILGLQSQDIIATAKHFPGKTLVANDPHKGLVIAEIDQVDLFPYDYLSKKTDVGGIMVTHVIALGEVNSEGEPSVVSQQVVGMLGDYGGLIITDDTMMLGLRNFYDSVDEMYIAVFNAGNDLILNFDEDPNEIHRMIQVVKSAVESGKISEEQIDISVKKILNAKGFVVE